MHWAAIALLAGLATRASAAAPNQFGAQDRADAASRLLVIAVQQAISALPPTSAQSFVYDYDPQIDTYLASPRLGPIAFRTPLTVGRGRSSIRLATSYFELSDDLGPVPYLFVDRRDGRPGGYTQFGLDVAAQVALVEVSATRGLTDTLEVSVNLPVAMVDASASQTFPTGPDDPPGTVAGAPTLGLLRDQLADGSLVTASEPFTRSGHSFNEATSVGLARTGVGARWLALATRSFRLAASLETFLPSPSEAEFAGSDSTSVLPRLIAMYEVADWARLHADAGYDYDFDVAELRRFAWNLGSSVSLPGFTVDAGFGGSEYAEKVEFTPVRASGVGSAVYPEGVDLTAVGDVSIDPDSVDFLGGLKLQVGAGFVVGGTVAVPLSGDGLRPDAVGTLSVEAYF